MGGVGGAGRTASRIIAGQEGHKIIIPVAASVSAPMKTQRAGRSSVGGASQPSCKL